MATRDSYPAGTFCWVDLATTDAPAAQRFYADLLGWEAPGVDRYVHWKRDGHDVAGVYPRAGAAHWTSYVAVADTDATVARAAALGGSVAEAPFDAGPEGRRALLRDPVGAHIALWQAGTHTGAQLVNDVGCWCANQLQAPDPAPAVGFYRALFGWEVEEQPDSEPRYWGVRNAGAENGGLVAADGPPEWVVYFHVADADATAGGATDAGGSVLFPPTTVAIGQIAVLADPQGAAFGIFAGRTDP